MQPVFGQLCRRYAARFTAVGAALHATCRRYAAHLTAVGAAVHTTAKVNAARFWAAGAGVMLLVLLLLVPPFTLRRG